MSVRKFSLIAFISLVSVLLGIVASVARAQCPLWENFQKARQNADDTARAFNNVVIPPDLEQRITALVIKKLLENPGMNMKNVLDEVRGELSPAEQAQVAPYLAARLLRDNAEKALKQADDAYRAEMNLKDAALKAAEKEFEQEQQWLESEKLAIRNIPRDNTYLDRVSRITQRLKAAYQKMNRDLDRFKACFPDMANFLSDKNERLAKIDALDAEIARRRGLPPPVAGANPADPQAQNPSQPQQPLPGEPPPPGPLGDTYVCDGPIVSPMQGKLTSVDATGFTYQKEVDGKKGTAGIKISKPPPLKVRAHERVEIVMTASGGDPAWVDGNWELNNVVAGQIPSDNGCSNIPKFKGQGDSSTATVRFYFGCGQNAYIRMYGGEYDSRDGTRMDIVWKYHKE